MTTPLFITGTAEDVGKTLVTLGVVSDLVNHFSRVGFIKPLGIARVRAGRDGIDIDALLIERVCSLHTNIKDMCPVTLSGGTWPQVSAEDSAKMLERMKAAYARVSEGRDVMVVEGTGNAALGSSLGLSNARLAATFGCKVLLVGGYGLMAHNPFDVAALNASFFRGAGVEVVGIVLNRVPADVLESYHDYAREVFRGLEIPLLGVLPHEPRLQTFRFLQVSEVLRGEMLCGMARAEQVITHVRIGAMTPHRAIPYLEPGSLIITPGDREDMVVTICACAARAEGGPAGLVLSGGETPHERILGLLEASRIPTFLAHEDSYTVASKIHDMPLRIQPTDEDKIRLAQQLVMTHVDLERILNAL